MASRTARRNARKKAAMAKKKAGSASATAPVAATVASTGGSTVKKRTRKVASKPKAPRKKKYGYLNEPIAKIGAMISELASLTKDCDKNKALKWRNQQRRAALRRMKSGKGYNLAPLTARQKKLLGK